MANMDLGNNVKVKKAVEYRIEIDKLVANLNKRVNEKGVDNKTIEKLKKELDGNVEKYNEALLTEHYESKWNLESPMLEMCKDPEYDKASVKVSIKSDTGVITYSVKTRKNLVDLIAYENAATKKLSVNGQWRYEIEYLCKHLAKKMGKDVNASNKSLPKYKISQDGQALFEKNPFSYKSLTKELQSIIDMIVGENVIKMTSYDVKFIEGLIHKEGKGILGIKTGDKKTLARLILKVIYRNIHEKQYNLEYREVKSEK